MAVPTTGVPTRIALLLLILLGAIYLLVAERFTVDLVALLILRLFVKIDLVTLAEGMSGFSNPATLTVGTMFVLSARFVKTRALSKMARLLTRLGQKPCALQVTLIVSVALPSAFVNNTPVVAVFLPLVLVVCAKHQVSPAKPLTPLFASQFGGVCTLIGTSTNLLVSSTPEKAEAGAFRIFEFSLLGLISLTTGILDLVVIGAPLNIIFAIVAFYLIPKFFSFWRIAPFKHDFFLLIFPRTIDLPRSGY